MTTPSDTIKGRIRAKRGVVRGQVVTAVGVLRTHLAERWTLNAPAEEVHLSRYQLIRAFDATIGTSPMAYLRWMCAEQMAQLLLSTDLPVAELARSAGWADANFASRCFHAHYAGALPLDVSKRSKSASPASSTS